MKRLKSQTCVAVLRSQRTKKLLMAADRRVSWSDGQVQKMPHPKVSKREDVLLAGTGDSYLCDLIVHTMPIQPVPSGLSTMEYMHKIFLRNLRGYLVDKGFKDEHNNLAMPEDFSAEICVGITGQLYSVSIYQPDRLSEYGLLGLIEIGELNLPYATGCGGHLAWGSLLTTERLGGLKDRERLQLALQVASDVSSGCDNNIDIISE